MTQQADIYRRVIAAKLFIDEYYHEPIHLKHISQKAFFSRFHFHRLFTRVYGRTPLQYLTAKRLQQANYFLQQEGISIQEVCNSVGFESLASFSLLFRKRNGYAPQYYRNLAFLKNKLAKEQPQRFIPNCIIQNIVSEESNIQ
ncbi:MAG: AraC family transcriptional regulator [Ginsengibacter sp.]